jgi:hypothetical protein
MDKLYLKKKERDVWLAQREHILRNLVRYNFVGEEFIEAALTGGYRAIVTFSLDQSGGDDAAPCAVVEYVHPTDVDSEQDPIETRVNRLRAIADADDQSETVTLGGWLAFILRRRLEELEKAEKAGRQPARRRKHPPRSVLSEFAIDVLEDCVARQYPPPLSLLGLVRALLKVDRPKAEGPRLIEARRLAIQKFAESDKINKARLAKDLSVHRSSIYKWERDPDFMRQVDDLRRAQTGSVGRSE